MRRQTRNERLKKDHEVVLPDLIFPDKIGFGAKFKIRFGGIIQAKTFDRLPDAESHFLALHLGMVTPDAPPARRGK